MKPLIEVKTKMSLPRKWDVVLYNNDLCFIEKIGVRAKAILQKESSDNQLKLAYYTLDTKNKMFNIIFDDIKDAMTPEFYEYYLKQTRTLKKGDYVSFNHNEELCYGTIVKGGSNTVNVLEKSGRFEISGHQSIFTIEKDLPVIEIPEELKEWSFVGFKEHKEFSEETIAFNVTVKKGNKKMFAASNRGYGGCMETHTLVKSDSSTVRAEKEFNDAVIASIQRLFKDEPQMPTLSEMDETYILWFNTYRKLNVTWKEHLKNYIFDFA